MSFKGRLPTTSKVLAVFGASGHQGGSVIRNVLADAELSSQYKIRALTRDPSSSKIKDLGPEVDAVHADFNDRSSLETALTEVHTLFLMSTDNWFEPNKEREIIQLVADTAVHTGVKYLIFSTLPHIAKLSHGQYTHAHHFDGKALAEDYIKGLPIKSAFISVGGYFQNVAENALFQPHKISQDTWAISTVWKPDTAFPLLDADKDIGKFVTTILTAPGKWEGKTICVAEKAYSQQDIADVLSRLTGKKVVYKQQPYEEFGQGFPFDVKIFSDFFRYGEEFGMWPENLDWADQLKDVVRGSLTGLEEYFIKNPIKLE